MKSEPRTCVRCIMDTSDPEIRFDARGVCNHCHDYGVLARRFLRTDERGREELARIVDDIRQSGRGREYDCVIGISGGVDSSFLAYTVRRLGLRPLAVHMDNGWDSELAVHNIEHLLKRLDIDLYTYVVDWEEFRDLHLAFLRASVPDAEIPTDHAILALIFRVAAERGIPYIISGMNIVTEGILPPSWTYGVHDLRYIRGVHRKFGSVPLRSFPTYSRIDWLRYALINRIKVIQLLNYVPYVRKEALRVLESELGWRNYGGKHYESVYTRFFQGYILPKKFGIDKRKAHLSTLICSGQITRDQAIEEMRHNPYLETQAEADREYVVKKLGLTDDEFGRILSLPIRSSHDYPTYRDWDPWYTHFLRSLSKLSTMRRTIYARLGRRPRVPALPQAPAAAPAERRTRVAYLTDVFTIHDARFLRQLLAGPFDPTLILFHAPGERIFARLKQFPTLPIRWHRFDIAPPAQRPRFLGPWRRARATWRAVRALRADLRDIHADVLHAGWVQTCGAVAALSGFRPFVLMPWGSDILVWPNTSRRERWMAQRALRSCDAVACDARTVQLAIKDLCPVPEHRFAVFPWGIELDLFHPGRRDPALRATWGPEGSFVLIMTRSFEPVYGVDTFLETVALLRRADPRIRAVLIGGGSLESSLWLQAERLGLRDVVRFIGLVPSEEMGRYVASADLYVSSSHSDGTSLSLLEAMACGLPVLVSDLPSNREWVQDRVNGRLAPPGQPDALAAVCAQMIADPAGLAEMGRRNLDIARERADWDRNFAKCAALYARLIGDRDGKVTA